MHSTGIIASIKASILFLLLLASFVSNCQKTAADTVQQTLEIQAVNSIVNNEFKQLLNTTADISAGDYASLDIANSEFNFNGSIIVNPNKKKKIHPIINIRGTAGITEGISSLFNSGNFSPTFGLSASYNKISSKYSIQINNEDRKKYDKELLDIGRNYTRDSLNIVQAAQLTEMQIERAKKQKDLKKKKDQLKKLEADGYTSINKKEKDELELLESIINEKNSIRQDSLSPEKKYMLIKKIQEYNTAAKNIRSAVEERKKNQSDKIKEQRYSIIKTQQELTVIDNNIEDYQLTIKSQKQRLLRQSKRDSLKSLKEEKALELIKTRGFHIKWMTYSIGVNSTGVNLMNLNAPFENQVAVDSSFIGITLDVRRSIYKKTYKNRGTNFISYGLRFSIGDNLSQLRGTRIMERRNFNALSPDDRFILSERTVFDLDQYQNNLIAASIYSNFYLFLFNKSTGALHLFPEIVFAENRTGAGNLGVGYFLTFKNNSGQTPLNMEVFYRFDDLLNSNDSELGLFSRGQLGLTFNFPFSFKSKFYGQKNTSQEQVQFD